MQNIVDKLQDQAHRDSTRANYHAIWKLFSRFFIRLDVKLKDWNDRVTPYVAYLIDSHHQSSTIKSYVSAIRYVLKKLGVKLCSHNEQLASLILACKLKNDRIQLRFPIRRGLVEILVKSVDKVFTSQQPYLTKLYRALIITTYFGLFRVGEVTASNHVVKAKDVHIATNKNKLMFVLHTSKTHNLGSKPQIIKINGNITARVEGKRPGQSFCPFKILREYINVRGHYISDIEQFFIFRDRSPVTPMHFRKLLKTLLKLNKLNPKYYCLHGFRAGMATDLLHKGVSVETIRKLGHWKSNTVDAVDTYLRT